MLGWIGDLNIDCSLSLNRHTVSASEESHLVSLAVFAFKFMTEYLLSCMGRAKIYNPFSIVDRVL